MGHKPSAENGMKLIEGSTEGVLFEIGQQADVKVAKIEQDRIASLKLMEKRHADELKALGRNFRHRKKKVARQMKEFEDLTVIELAARFPGDEWLPKNLFDENLWFGVDYAGLEHRMSLVMAPRSHGKSDIFRHMHGCAVDIETVEKDRIKRIMSND